MPSGMSAYTRDGGLKRSADGQIVTSGRLSAGSGHHHPVRCPQHHHQPDGEVLPISPIRWQPAAALGQISLASFTNEGAARRSEANLFLETAASGPAVMGCQGQDGLGTLQARLSGGKRRRFGARDHRTDQGAARL